MYISSGKVAIFNQGYLQILGEKKIRRSAKGSTVWHGVPLDVTASQHSFMRPWTAIGLLPTARENLPFL